MSTARAFSSARLRKRRGASSARSASGRGPVAGDSSSFSTEPQASSSVPEAAAAIAPEPTAAEDPLALICVLSARAARREMGPRSFAAGLLRFAGLGDSSRDHEEVESESREDWAEEAEAEEAVQRADSADARAARGAAVAARWIGPVAEALEGSRQLALPVGPSSEFRPMRPTSGACGGCAGSTMLFMLRQLFCVYTCVFVVCLTKC